MNIISWKHFGERVYFVDKCLIHTENLIYAGNHTKVHNHNHSMLLTNNINCIPRTNVLGGYYGLAVVTPGPQTLNRLRDNLTNPYQIASILYM